jgi:hypothetical protein
MTAVMKVKTDIIASITVCREIQNRHYFLSVTS